LKLSGHTQIPARDSSVNYKAILVYDISRWGRFQNNDEAAYYEFLCATSGIPLHYCAEQFANDQSPSSAILKALKRSMAAEFSRELSVKVFECKCRLVRLGFWVGGPGWLWPPSHDAVRPEGPLRN
jgi:DNA invertase Pin-like site-specific DNA recombinase